MMAHARAQGDTQSQQSAADGFLAAVQSALLANRRAAP
jgi:hypothetical protein